MGQDRTIVFSTELGWMSATWRSDLLREFSFGHANPDQALRALRCGAAQPEEPTGSLRRFAARLRAFAHQPADEFSDVELDLSEHTPFQRRVIEQCRTIPIGSIKSYAELARAAGHPGAARAVGQVMATNRFPLIVPCHRVVASGGLIGGYSAPDGLQMKRRLLALEKAALEESALEESAAGR